MFDSVPNQKTSASNATSQKLNFNLQPASPSSSFNIRQKVEMVVEEDQVAGIEIKNVTHLSNRFGVDKNTARVIIKKEDELSDAGEALQRIEKKIDQIEENSPEDTQKIKKMKEKQQFLISRFEKLYEKVSIYVEKYIILPFKTTLEQSTTINLEDDFFEKSQKASKRYYFQTFIFSSLNIIYAGFEKLIQGKKSLFKNSQE